MKSNNIFMDYLTNLIECETRLTDYLTIKYLSNLTNDDFSINYKTEEEKQEINSIHEKIDSYIFRQKCLYELFPEILGEIPYWLLNDSEEEKKLMIKPDIVDKENNKYYFSICDEQVECNEFVSTNDYRQLHALTMKKLLETKKITPQTIEQAIKIIEKTHPKRYPSRMSK